MHPLPRAPFPPNFPPFPYLHLHQRIPSLFFPPFFFLGKTHFRHISLACRYFSTKFYSMTPLLQTFILVKFRLNRRTWQGDMPRLLPASSWPRMTISVLCKIVLGGFLVILSSLSIILLVIARYLAMNPYQYMFWSVWLDMELTYSIALHQILCFSISQLLFPFLFAVVLINTNLCSVLILQVSSNCGVHVVLGWSPLHCYCTR